MGIKFGESELGIYRQIDHILRFDWNPIGLSDDDPFDEYQTYLPNIYELKKSGAGAESIASALYSFETGSMGLPGNISDCKKAAQKIVAL